MQAGCSNMGPVAGRVRDRRVHEGHPVVLAILLNRRRGWLMVDWLTDDLGPDTADDTYGGS
jgi:hypothetical protein